MTEAWAQELQKQFPVIQAKIVSILDDPNLCAFIKKYRRPLYDDLIVMNCFQTYSNMSILRTTIAKMCPVRNNRYCPEPFNDLAGLIEDVTDQVPWA